MTLTTKVLALAVVSVVVAAGIPASATLLPPDPQETGPVYSIEGPWFGCGGSNKVVSVERDSLRNKRRWC